MNITIRFLLAWLTMLALLVSAAWITVTHTTRSWFEKDVALRSELAVNGARRALLDGIERGDAHGLSELLADISRDERILAATLCLPDLRTLGATRDFPPALDCAHIGQKLHGDSPANWQPWSKFTELPGGDIYVSAFPLFRENRPLGFIVLIHDLSYTSPRERSTRRFLLIAFVILAVLASAVTLLGVRLLWRRWSDALRRMALGEADVRRPEFMPLLKDMRALLDRLAHEESSELGGGRWSPQRLKLTLQRHLHGERLIVVANREPYIHDRLPDGGIRVLHPASGLVSALEPVMRACSGVWVAHGAGSADRETVDARDHVRVPPDEESYFVRRMWLSPEEEKGYYYGLANEGLWPLCHVAHARPIFRVDDWQHYRDVNQRFADAVVQEADTDDPVILVQDYHFALLPKLLRERLPRATVITFWHIPWPNAEQISICPWHKELIEGLLGSSILGFHTQFHCNNFLDAADRFLESRIDREDFAVVQNSRRTLIRPYPISVEWPSRWAKAAPPADLARASVFAELKLPPGCRLGVGVDRLDYTKGIEERFRAVERLLEREPQWQGRFSFLQIASPSRTLIERYGALNADVEALANRINERFATGEWSPILLQRRHAEPAEVFRLYRAADICYVSSLHDGMNLVAKEFIAARDDERGVLILSKFTGAARELAEALIVNPYDTEEAASALAAALAMPEEEQRARMYAMRSLVSELNVYRWAGRMLLDASRLRRSEQLAGLLGRRDEIGR
ncbi:MAG: trehalose-6-phosphate synthase [Ferrovibrio sp.]|uniref:alpha,alpha-trehalose-phosphate synthase (UDP-forming) n=1 Tax=Ferrovibrio sp. TaxID=1917215 RepID=UPI002622BF43|nr:trehalose-6-phosphate synthase [Ferrovibrio sp.]MCW0235751.1 trehalose-6-phosphate synthase [Ferrovibrio sp.]